MRYMGEPEYKRVANAIRSLIDAGEIKEGEAIPSENELMKTFHVGRNTARSAVAELTSAGLITSQQGRGRFVRRRNTVRLWASRIVDQERTNAVDRWTEDVRAQGHHPTQKIEVQIASASPEIAEKLRIEAGDSIAIRRRIQFVDDQPWRLSESNFPMTLVSGTRILEPEDIKEGVIAYSATLGMVVDHNQDELTCRMPTLTEARLLDVSSGTPVLVQYRTAFDYSGEPLRTSHVVMPGDRIRLIYEVQA